MERKRTDLEGIKEKRLVGKEKKKMQEGREQGYRDSSCYAAPNWNNREEEGRMRKRSVEG